MYNYTSYLLGRTASQVEIFIYSYDVNVTGNIAKLNIGKSQKRVKNASFSNFFNCSLSF